MLNPFEIKNYYIYESNKSISCNNKELSRIAYTDDTITDVLKYTDLSGIVKKEAINLMEIQNYLFTETSKLIVNLQLVRKCDNTARAMNRNHDIKFSTECNKTFKNFSKEYIKNLKFNLTMGNGKYTSQIDRGKNPFSKFDYTDEYINSKNNPNDLKSLCQRYNDIGQMLKDFLNILNNIVNSPLKDNYMDQYRELLVLYENNNILRDDLEKKLEIVSDGEHYRNSKEFLDSTIYVSVLWTILSTTILFYIFKKM
jgi:hypothetical protein